jgi:hypothetical protein
MGRDWRDRHPRFHFYDQLEPSPDARSTATRSRSSRDSPSRLRRPHSAGGRLRGLPIRAAPHPVSLGYDSSGIPRTARDHARNPGGCDLAGVALADLPMAPPGTVRPHQGLGRLLDFFSSLVCELRASRCIWRCLEVLSLGLSPAPRSPRCEHRCATGLHTGGPTGFGAATRDFGSQYLDLREKNFWMRLHVECPHLDRA